MNEAQISCVLPTYRRPETLPRAIASALNQSYPNIEVIVVDDNSAEDPSSQAVRELVATSEDARLRYVTPSVHRNGAAARNYGVGVARGEFIAFLDDDDEWVSGKLVQQVTYLRQNPEYDGVTCRYAQYRGGVLVRESPKIDVEGLHLKVLQRTVDLPTSTLLFRTSALLESGLFDESLERHQDLQLLLDFLESKNIGNVNEVLVDMHTDSAINRPHSKNILAVKDNFFRAASRHFSRYTIKTRQAAKSAHYFEVMWVAIRDRDFLLLAQAARRISWRPSVVVAVLRRAIER